MTKRAREVIDAYRVANDARIDLCTEIEQKKIQLTTRAEALVARAEALDVLLEVLDDCDSKYVNISFKTETDREAAQKLVTSLGGTMEEIKGSTMWKVGL